MRMIPIALTALAAIMLITIAWRVTGGPLGPKSYGFIAVTVAVIIAAVVSWRRRPRTGTVATPAGRI